MGKTLEELLALYECHKIVKAVKVLEVHDFGTTEEAQGHPLVTVVSTTGYRQRLRLPLPPEYNRSVLVPNCYYVVYSDGYTSLSPAKAFEEGYILANVPCETTSVTLDPNDPDPIATVKELRASTTDYAWNAAPYEVFEEDSVLVAQPNASIKVKLDPDNLDPYSTLSKIKTAMGTHAELAVNKAPEEFWGTQKVQHHITIKLVIKRVAAVTEDGFAQVRLDDGTLATTIHKATMDDCIVYNPEIDVSFVRPSSEIGTTYKLNLKAHLEQ